ncbi:hypothetical protein Tco_0885349 [Tanacetum coccineum]
MARSPGVDACLSEDESKSRMGDRLSIMIRLFHGGKIGDEVSTTAAYMYVQLCNTRGRLVRYKGRDLAGEGGAGGRGTDGGGDNDGDGGRGSARDGVKERSGGTKGGSSSIFTFFNLPARAELVLEVKEPLLPLTRAEEGSFIVIVFKVSSLNVDFDFKIDLIVFGPEIGSAPVSFSSGGWGVESSASDNLDLLLPVIDTSELSVEDFTNTGSFGPELECLHAAFKDDLDCKKIFEPCIFLLKGFINPEGCKGSRFYKFNLETSEAFKGVWVELPSNARLLSCTRYCPLRKVVVLLYQLLEVTFPRRLL